MSIAAEKWLEQGRTKGRLEGKAEGRAEAKAETLLRQLRRRFGPLPEAARDRILAADLVTLDLWLDRVIDASSLEEVLARIIHQGRLGSGQPVDTVRFSANWLRLLEVIRRRSKSRMNPWR